MKFLKLLPFIKGTLTYIIKIKTFFKENFFLCPLEVSIIKNFTRNKVRSSGLFYKTLVVQRSINNRESGFLFSVTKLSLF